MADCVLALGFEKMERGSLTPKVSERQTVSRSRTKSALFEQTSRFPSQFTDRTNPMDHHVEVMYETFGIASAPITPQMFGNAGREHMSRFGTTPDHFAKIAYKNHLHSTRNP